MSKYSTTTTRITMMRVVSPNVTVKPSMLFLPPSPGLSIHESRLFRQSFREALLEDFERVEIRELLGTRIRRASDGPAARDAWRLGRGGSAIAPDDLQG
jgi:hypothetical protein